MKPHTVALLAVTSMAIFSVIPTSAQEMSPFVPSGPPFTATRSNNTPLAFGMDEGTTARALGVPLTYISGRPGNEVYLAFRDNGGSDLFNRQDRLYLQFRRGRLTGWKGDWGRNWIWQ